jgi:anti-sigma B factor antagonist
MSTPNTLTLDGTLTIHRAAELHALMRTQLDAGVSRIDLAAVTECDAAGVQLLLALRRSLEASGQRLHIDAASPAVHEALTRCGLQELVPTA